MLLGDVLARVERIETSGDVTSLLADLPLMARVAAVAAEDGTEPDAYVLSAVRRFERDASPDDWVSLMGALTADDDAGGACLKRIVDWSLRRDQAPT
jgi:hypothetical protein